MKLEKDIRHAGTTVSVKVRPIIHMGAFLCMAMLIFLIFPGTPAAQEKMPQADAQGSSDHPLISRFPNSVIIGYFQKDWEQTAFPLSPDMDTTHFKKQAVVEGRITRIVYLGPVGKSRLEVYRNYERALLAAGLQKKFGCEGNCGQIFMHWRFDYLNSMTWAKGLLTAKGQNGGWPLENAIAPEEGRCIYGTLKHGGRDIHVLMYTSIAGPQQVDAPATFIEIAEPKEMESGQVTVDANALMSDLTSEGKVALYGIYFDTGKAEIKPESKPQLEEMGKLLKDHTAFKVFIVGHTDNQGTFENNVILSKQRAAAVIDALVKTYGIDARRMIPYGVANVAPVASNAEETGRAKNRRVELVSQ